MVHRSLILLCILSIGEFALVSMDLNLENNLLVSLKEDHLDLPSSDTLDHMVELTKHQRIDDLILLFKDFDDTQQLKFAQDICDRLMSEPLNWLGRPPYGNCYENIGIVMLATYRDISSLYAFLETAVENYKNAACNFFLHIALVRFQNRFVWYDAQSNQTLLVEPQFERFIEKIAHYCPLPYYLRKFIRTARDQYRLKYQNQDLPKSWKIKYWNLCLSWFEDRKNYIDGEIALDLYKFLIEEKIIKCPKRARGCAYKDFVYFYKYLTGTEKVKVISNFDVDGDLSAFFEKYRKKQSAIREKKL